MFIDDWFGSGFYKELPLGYHTSFSFGQFFWTHAYYPHENLELWRPVPDPNEATKSYAGHFQLQPAGRDAFNRGFPLYTPALKTDEEFLVVRAKVRPVLLIQPEIPIADVDNRGYRGKVHRRRCTVAQVFGLAEPATGHASFSPAFVERVRRMEYPQLMFLPKKPGLFNVDSIMRMDELQSVFIPHLKATKFALADEVSSILCDQIQFLFTRKGPNAYTELRELILTS